MDIETYMREARRFDNHKPETMLDALAHGLMAEVGEVVECVGNKSVGLALFHELGDVAWNLARLADETGTDPESLAFPRTGPPEDRVVGAAILTVRAAHISGLLEKSHRAAPPSWHLREEIGRLLFLAWQALSALADRCGYAMEGVMQANIDKLTARYAEPGAPQARSIPDGQDA